MFDHVYADETPELDEQRDAVRRLPGVVRGEMAH
jgi:hypothetical protein